MPRISSCNTVKKLFTVSEAESAIRELLSVGSEFGGKALAIKGIISKESILSSVLPEGVNNLLGKLETLGLSKEISRFSATLSTAAAAAAEKAVPVFLLGIKKMNIRDAAGIVKNGGTACTDYLRTTIGDTLRRSIVPVMNTALEEYKLVTEWNKLVEPVKIFSGDKLNLNLSSLMSGLLANRMFSAIEQKEIEIRTKAAARKSALLQKVFSGLQNK